MQTTLHPRRPRAYTLAPPIMIMIIIYSVGLAFLIVRMAKGKTSLWWIAAIPVMATTTLAINIAIWYSGMMQEQYHDLAWKKTFMRYWYYPRRRLNLFLLRCKHGKPRLRIYEPLNPKNREIRLLSIAQGQLSDEIDCTLHVADMCGEDLDYEALSYTWGPSHSPHHIRLNKSPFVVTVNLYNALKQFRLANTARTMWMDALAIDQSNLGERGQQVLMMNEIYSRARRVIVWLGDETPITDKAMRFMHQAQMEDDYEAWFRSSLETNFDSLYPDWQAVIQLFKNEYWRRVWIVQETAVAAELIIQCGSLTLPWQIANAAQEAWTKFRAQATSIEEQHLLNAVEAIPMEEKNVTVVTRAPRNMGPASLTVIRNDIRAAGNSTLIDLLTTTWNSLATDPRDKIYALLSLARDFQEPVLPANYELSPWEVYISVVDFMIRTRGNLDLISYSGLHISYIPTLSRVPTWTPTFYWTWEAPTTGAHNQHIYRNSGKDFRASRDREAIATVNVRHTRLSDTFGFNLGTLQASACRIDRIDRFLFVSNKHLSRYISRDLSPLQEYLAAHSPSAENDSQKDHHAEDFKLVDDIRTLYHYFVLDGLMLSRDSDETGGAHSEKTKRTEELWRTLIFNRTVDGKVPPDDWSLLFEVIIKGPSLVPTTFDDPRPNSSGAQRMIAYVQPYLQAFGQTVAAKRSVFVTADGKLGLSNLTAKVGDFVCVILGCNVPMVARIRGLGRGATLHGPAYFHDYMGGRAIDEVKSGSLAVETISFR